MFPPPKKPHLWRDWLTNGLGKKRDTSKVVGSAYNQQNQVFYLGFGVLLSEMPGQTQIPLYSGIFVKCREISLLSRGADSQKSGKAIGEIAFGNAGKNSIANSSAAPTDFICCRRANFSWEPAEYFRRGELLKCFYFPKS